MVDKPVRGSLHCRRSGRARRHCPIVDATTRFHSPSGFDLDIARGSPAHRHRADAGDFGTRAMNRFLALLLCLLVSTPALAQAPYEEAVLLYEDKDYKGAREIAEAAAKNGDARAMAMLGLFYQKGLGVTADLNK